VETLPEFHLEAIPSNHDIQIDIVSTDEKEDSPRMVKRHGFLDTFKEFMLP
jgi:hypothetical protein